MLPAYLTLTLVILHYLSNQQRSENPVDRRLISFVKPKAWKQMSSRDSETWTQALEASVLMFSDIQVITGMAILLCGYTQLADGLDSYHWVMVVNLAWFSSLTHLATLSSLRSYFRARPSMAVCRAVFMGVVLVMLVVSYGTTGYISQFGSRVQLSWPAQCLFSSASMSEIGKSDFNPEFDGNHGHRPLYNKPLVVLSIVFLVISYFTRVVRIFSPTTGLGRRWLNTAPRKRMREGYGSVARKAEEAPRTARSAFRNMDMFLRALVYIISKALYDIGGSILWEVRGSHLD